MGTKSVHMTIKVEPDLRREFMAAAAIRDRPASQVLRDLMRLYIANNRMPNAETLATFQKTDQGEDIFYAKDAQDLFRQLDM